MQPTGCALVSLLRIVAMDGPTACRACRFLRPADSPDPARTSMRRSLWVATACAALALPAGAQAADTYDSKPYRDSVTVANMLKHERALQSFADANAGTRAAGTSGNEATTDYVTAQMKA